MVSNKQSLRAFVAFLVTWSFAVLGVTGLVLYVVPQGRVAFWTHWSLLGLGKTDWGNVHMLFGGVFIVTGILHLYFNWKPFTSARRLETESRRLPNAPAHARSRSQRPCWCWAIGLNRWNDGSNAIP